jgi:hypothetical protein
MSLAGRGSRFLVLALFVAAFSGCAARSTDVAGVAPSASVCRDGAGSTNRQAPIVCVDDSARTLSVNPDPVVVHDVRANDRKTPVTVHWFTRSGRGDLQLEFEAGCVEQHRCDGQGHCWARSVPGSTSRCKYDVWIAGGKHDRLDPVVEVETCCG